jgi:hypothetical protein
MRYILLFILVLSLPLNAIKSKKEQMICELETLANFFEAAYGPQEYKSQTFQWDLAAELKKCKNQIVKKKSMSTKEFHQLLLQFCQSSKDYHVGIFFAATERSTLPLWIKHADNRYFIMDPKTRRAAAEIILFDKLPVDCVVEALRKRYYNCTNKMTDKALATLALRAREGAMGLPTPKGKVELVVRENGEDSLIEMEWEHSPELIAFTPVPQLNKNQSTREYKTPYAKFMKETDSFASEDSYVPAFGKPIWTSPGGLNNPFNAAIYQIDSSEKIGYIRIPHFSGNDNDAELFRQIINHLEKKTDLLVVDLTRNPGGSAFYCLALISMLTDKPIPNIQESFLLNPSVISDKVDLLAMLSEEDALLYLKSNSNGYPFAKSDVEAMQSHCKQLIADWCLKKTYSDFAPFQGMETIRPHPKTRYTKPLVVIVDEQCFSCGDVFPALLQDAKRATIFGQTTAGAGGCVEGFSYPNHMGVDLVSITVSMLHRAGDIPIENVGVTPDIIYTITPEDLMDGFQGYKVALIEAIKYELHRSKSN